MGVSHYSGTKKVLGGGKEQRPEGRKVLSSGMERGYFSGKAVACSKFMPSLISANITLPGAEYGKCSPHPPKAQGGAVV